MHLPKPDSGNFELTPAGTFPARCYRFIDLGSHPQEFKGESKGLRRLVMIGFELCDEFMSDGRPFTIHKRYTFSMHEKANMRKDLEAWRGAKFTDADFGENGFDTRNLIGVPAILTIVHSEGGENTYANIAGIGKAMKGMVFPELVNPPCYVALEPDLFDKAAYDTLSDKLKETIGKSPEWQKLNGLRNGYAQAKGTPANDPARDRRLEQSDDEAGPREFAPLDDEDVFPGDRPSNGRPHDLTMAG